MGEAALPVGFNPENQAGAFISEGFLRQLRRSAEWIRERGFRRVCVQIPDDKLKWSTTILRQLKEAVHASRTQGEGRAQDEALHPAEGEIDAGQAPRLPPPPPTPPPPPEADGTPAAHRPEVEFYVAADAAEGRGCCVDEVTARHVDADCVVHIGHTCMSQPVSLPVYHVLPWEPLDDVDACADAMLGATSTMFPPGRHPPPSSSQNEMNPNLVLGRMEGTPGEAVVVVVVFALQYAHAMPELERRVGELQQSQGKQTPTFVFARVRSQEMQPALGIGTPRVNQEPEPAVGVDSGRCSNTNGESSVVIQGCNGGGRECCRNQQRTQDPQYDTSCVRDSSATCVNDKEGDGASRAGEEDGRVAAGSKGSATTEVQTNSILLHSNGHTSGTHLQQQVKMQQGALEWSIPAPRTALDVPQGGCGTPPGEAEEGSSEVVYLWVGPETGTLTNLALVHNSRRLFRMSGDGRVEEHGVETSRVLRRRYYLVERAKEASIVGIVVASAGFADARETVVYVKRMVESSGRKAYTIAMSRVTPAKLANFPECEVMVLVGCPESVLLDSRDYYTPLITPYEAELAFGEGKQWSGVYGFSVTGNDKKLLGESPENGETGGSAPSGDESEVGDEGEEEEPRFSLIQGGYVSQSSRKSLAMQPTTPLAADRTEASGAAGMPADGTIVLKEAAGSLIVTRQNGQSLVHSGYATPAAVVGSVKSGSEFLSQRREYKGMEVPWFMGKKGGEDGGGGWTVQEEKEAGGVVEGRTGRAATYEGEGK